MVEEAKYYAIVDHRASLKDPAGIARRRLLGDGGFHDEALAADLSWKFTPLIVEWERAESTADLVEITEDEANQVIERLRARWGAAS